MLVNLSHLMDHYSYYVARQRYKDLIYLVFYNRIYTKMLYNYVVVSTRVEKRVLWF
jgi:hypothetical protein